MTIASESPNPFSENLFAGGGEMGALMRSHDWSSTPLGPVENWPPTLRSLVSTILVSRFPHAILWGDDYLQFYNDGCIPIYGANHPKALAQPVREIWTEIWDDQLNPMFSGIRDTGEAFYAEDLPYQLFRSGYLEEAYFTFSYSQIRDETGTFRGLFCTATHETTEQVLSRRRLTMLRELGSASNGAKTLQSACLAAAATLNPYDIPFAVFYQIHSQGDRVERVALSGLNPDSAAAPTTVALTAPEGASRLSSTDLGWRLAEVLQSREPLLMTDVIERFGSLPVEPWNESPHSAFILPILSSNKEQVECLLVAGISPRLAFNAAYRSFLELVAQQVESVIATARSYEEERKRAEALAELDRAKTTFFSNVSHEFRTPLTLMLGLAEDALRDPHEPLSPHQQQRIEIIQRNGLRLLKLVNTLLDFSRIENNRIQAIYEPTDLPSFTVELASVFRSALERAKLRFVVDCSPLPEPVYVDRPMWEKIVLNLLSNAFKFTFAGEITVRLRQANSHVELTVQDTGLGIAAKDLPRLFERFYQGKGARGRSFEGSGIGLSLVQELVKLHDGTIEVRSVEGEGSCFTVSIPTGFAHLPPEQIGSPQTLLSTLIGASAYVEEALGWLPQEGTGNTGTGDKDFSSHSRLPLCLSPSPSSARILLVDDNADMRSYLKRLLEERWQVETAANGAIALTQIQQNPPDLVLTDVMMPEMNGLQLLQALRSNPQTQSIPIILLSARAGEAATIEGLETGADDYLIKPFSARELIARVETHLQLALLRQERSANRFKTEFLLTVTHELQAPLALILGWVRLSQTRSLDVDTTAQALATIERNATIEAKLVKDLLDVSGLLSGKVQLKSQVVELAPLLQSVITQFRAAAIAKQIQLVETVLNVPQRNVVADGDRFKQIIANLLENAIKFTPEGGQVTVQLECTDSEIYITVADTGIGIPPDFLPYVFDRFTQAEVPSRHSPGGVGIGLAITRLLVELHKGTIEVTSEGEGRGATFTVRLPLVNTVPNPNLTTPGR